MLRVVTVIAACWNEITAETLQKSWRKILTQDSEIESQPTQSQESTASAEMSSSESAGVEDIRSMLLTLGHDLSEEEICEWLASDQHEQGYTHFTDQEIVSNITQQSTRHESGESDDDDDDDVQENPPVSHSSAVKMFDECLQWLQAQEEASMYNITILQELRG